jgi:hypothetical protein
MDNSTAALVVQAIAFSTPQFAKLKDSFTQLAGLLGSSDLVQKMDQIIQ